MPSEQTARHQREIGLVAEATASEVRSAARSAAVDDIDAWWDTQGPGIERAVARGFNVTADLAARYLAADALLAGAEVAPVAAVVELAQIATSLRVTGPVAFKQHVRAHGEPLAARRIMANRLAASTNRLVLAGSRETIIATAETSPSVARWRRVAQSGACDFCQMLAGRGFVYTERSGSEVVGRGGRPRGNRRIGQSYHDSCRCYVEIDWSVGPPPAPPTPPPPPPAPPTQRPPAQPPPRRQVNLTSLDADLDSRADFVRAAGRAGVRPGEVFDVPTGPSTTGARQANRPGAGVGIVDDSDRVFFVEIGPGGRSDAEVRLQTLAASVKEATPGGLDGPGINMAINGDASEIWGSGADVLADANRSRILHYNGQVDSETHWHETGHAIMHEINSRAQAAGLRPGLVGSGAQPGPQWGTARLADSGHLIQMRTSGQQTAFSEDRVNTVIGDPIRWFDGTGAWGGQRDAGVTNYAASNEAEDWAESWRLYVRDRQRGRLGTAFDQRGNQFDIRFADLFPSRARYIDDIVAGLGLTIT